VFDPVARGDDRPDSDVDVLIEFGGPADLFDLVRVKRTPGAIRPQHRDAIDRDLKRAA
jgi:predicted nucleotidyltransferase